MDTLLVEFWKALIQGFVGKGWSCVPTSPSIISQKPLPYHTKLGLYFNIIRRHLHERNDE